MKARRRRNFFFLVVTIIDDPPRSGVWPGVGETLPERSSAFKTHSITGTPFRPEKGSGNAFRTVPAQRKPCFQVRNRKNCIHQYHIISLLTGAMHSRTSDGIETTL